MGRGTYCNHKNTHFLMKDLHFPSVHLDFSRAGAATPLFLQSLGGQRKGMEDGRGGRGVAVNASL